MLSVSDFRGEVVKPILERFTGDQNLANAYCAIWAVDAYATHMALEGEGRPDNGYSLEKKFKENLAKRSWQFRVIKEASNAAKHAIRKQSAKDVKLSSDIKPDAGVGWYAYFNNVDGGVTIDIDWEYRSNERAYFDSDGEKVEGFNGIGKTIYLSNIINAAVEAIEGDGAKNSV